eukprot:UN3561
MLSMFTCIMPIMRVSLVKPYFSNSEPSMPEASGINFVILSICCCMGSSTLLHSATMSESFCLFSAFSKRATAVVRHSFAWSLVSWGGAAAAMGPSSLTCGKVWIVGRGPGPRGTQNLGPKSLEPKWLRI